MSKATIERRAIGILHDFQRSRKVWGDLVSDGLSQANALVNVQLQQGYVDNPGYWPPALNQFLDLKDRFESKLQKRAEAMAMDLETTFTKMSAQYSKMKLQTSQFEYLMEEATETFGEAFTYREPLGTTCTIEQIWIQLEHAFGLYTLQITLNREILDQLVARNQNYQPLFIMPSEATETGEYSESTAEVQSNNSASATSGSINTGNIHSLNNNGLGGMVPPVRRDKDQGMILLSAWLNQPYLKTEALATFDEFCKVELFEKE